MARRPRWIAALVLALAVGAIFAALGQWQLGRAVQQGTVTTYPTEKVLPIASVTAPEHPVTDRAAGQLVSIVAARQSDDTSVVSDRINYGKTGFWVVTHLVDARGVSVAVAVGWAPTKSAADAAAHRLQAPAASARVVGRYQPTEPPDQQDFEHGVNSVVSVPALVNEWTHVPTSVYSGYLVAQSAPPGLDRIYSPKPTDQVTLDWLNVFYAIEWAVFAGFAVYLWYRLVKDAWQRELEDAEEAAAASTASADSERIN